MCLPAGGLLDCSQSSIFPYDRRGRAHFLTGDHLGYRVFVPSLAWGLDYEMEPSFGAAEPRRPHIWTILRKDKGQ